MKKVPIKVIHILIRFSTSVAVLFFTFYVNAQVPPRKAVMGIMGKPVTDGFSVDSVIANSTAAALQLKKGDILTTMNRQETKTLAAYNAIASQVRTGDAVAVEFLRNNKPMKANGKAVMRPYETSDIADIQYDWVKFRDGWLRTITRKPKGKTNVPAILLIPGYGCGSIENYSISYNGNLLNEWLKNGYAVITIEKSGLGDSYGCLPCTEVDLVTDIESFDAGYTYMEQLPFVDKSQLFVWGHSMGGVIAPEVAKRHQPKGVMVFGSTFRPWSEFLLEMHRVQKPLLENMTYTQTEAFMRTIQKIYYEFFILKKSPAQLYQIPEYKDLVASELNYKEGSTNQWGRHWRYWQQIDSLNLTESWQRVNCPVLIVHGDADYEQCSDADPLLMQETINAAHPGFASLVTIPDLDHFMMKSSNWKQAVENFRKQEYMKGNFNPRIADETVKWLKAHTSNK